MEIVTCPECKAGTVNEVRMERYEGPLWADEDGEFVELEGERLEDNLERVDAWLSHYECDACQDAWGSLELLKAMMEVA
jgi:hypothetical protein